MKKDLVIIGGGPAGLAAAISAYDNGIKDIVVLEREEHLGGILNQCIHNGFGLHTFKEELTGPEYAHRFEKEVRARKIECKTNTTVLDMRNKRVTAVNTEGVLSYEATAVIVACGCRERPRGALNIAGTRTAGIYSAGTAQKYVNMMGYNLGKKVVILGSGDIGLIMARRMKFEGSKVLAVIELMPYSSGLNRNIVQCLNDFDIPLYFSSTITEVIGRKRLEAVAVCEVDKNFAPILSTKRIIECDTLLLSVGLIPENELSKQAHVQLSGVTGGAVVDSNLMTSEAGIFACGNVLHVHDIVDFVSQEAAQAGANAAKYIKGQLAQQKMQEIVAQNGVRYVVPQLVDVSVSAQNLKFRVARVFENAYTVLKCGDKVLLKKKRRIMTPGEMESIDCDFSKMQIDGQLYLEVQE